MKVIYQDDTVKYDVCEVITNHSMTVQDALDICNIDMDKWAAAQGWDNYDYNALYMDYGTIKRYTESPIRNRRKK